MTRKSIRLGLALFVFLNLVTVEARAQQAEIDELQRRVEKLEQLIGQLQRQIASIETQIQGYQERNQPTAAKGNWHERGSWRLLRRGMTMEQVKGILGEPEKVDAQPVFTYWRWGEFPTGGDVEFDVNTDRVAGWSEPSR